jgi:hypothetical protein
MFHNGVLSSSAAVFFHVDDKTAWQVTQAKIKGGGKGAERGAKIPFITTSKNKPSMNLLISRQSFQY